MIKQILPAVVAAALSLGVAHAQTAADLGKTLTPMGAIKAGNAAGTIPAWDGGITSPAKAGFPDFKSGGHHPDPFAADKPLYTIDGKSFGKYDALLPAGAKSMFKTYGSTYKMTVYPTRRSGAVPQRIYDATIRNASSAKLTGGGNGVTGAINGVPFPVPTEGVQVIWNHIMRYRAENARRVIGQAAVTRDGKYNMVKFRDELLSVYAQEGAKEENLNNTILYFTQETLSPARLAGEILLVHETLDQAKEHRRAWIYSPGTRRVRRAPNVAFDNPGTNSDGLRTSDQLDIFNGSPERYEWKLLGRKEMLVPYNSYKMHSNKLKDADIIRPLHLNQDHARYELHRVWVLDSVLKPGMRHIYKRRTFYIDEDTWNILAVDCYDNRDQLWRYQESHTINYYEIPTVWSTMEATYDLQAGRYLALGFDNEEPKTVDFNMKFTVEDFSPNALRSRGVR
jgi:hypothetical protein